MAKGIHLAIAATAFFPICELSRELSTGESVHIKALQLFTKTWKACLSIISKSNLSYFNSTDVPGVKFFHIRELDTTINLNPRATKFL